VPSPEFTKTALRKPLSSAAPTEDNGRNRLANANAVRDAACLIFMMKILAIGQIWSEVSKKKQQLEKL
jgi:hypothetical protein